MALSAEATVELQGVRGKMLKLRAEADNATERADSLAKQLKEMTDKYNQMEEERNNLHRQSINLNDQLFNVDGQLKETMDKLAEVDASRDMLLNEVKSLNHRLNMMDAAEENFKMQLDLERDRASSADTENSELKRTAARLQMENDKYEQDVAMLQADNNSLAQMLKEAEDRIAELTSSYNQIVIENRQQEKHRRGHHQSNNHHPHQPIQAPVISPAVTHPQTDNRQSEKQTQQKQRELESAYGDLSAKDARIQQLESEIDIYQANHKMLTDQLQEMQQVTMELRKQAKGAGPVMDQLADAKDQLKALNKQLTDSETKCAQYEAENDQMRYRLTILEKQLNDQKEAYGELYTQMNRTINDIQLNAEQGAHDF